MHLYDLRDIINHIGGLKANHRPHVIADLTKIISNHTTYVQYDDKNYEVKINFIEKNLY